MRQGTNISVKQLHLILIEDLGLSTCNNGAAITPWCSLPVIGLAEKRRRQRDSVIWWTTDTSPGNHGRPTTLKPFIDFCMLPFSDERDIFNGLWLPLCGDHGWLVDGGGGGGGASADGGEREKKKSSVLIIALFPLDIHGPSFNPGLLCETSEG